MSYVVYIHVNGGWVRASRPFEQEYQAHGWASDLDRHVTRRVRAIPDE